MQDVDVLSLLRVTHVLAGLAGLGLFWVPVFAAKGGRMHVRSGRLFTWCACYGGSTGLVLSCWALLHPWSFFGDADGAPIDDRTLAIELSNSRFLYSITGFLALGVLTGTLLGLRVVNAKNDHCRLRSPLVIALLSAMGVWSVGLAAFGAWNVWACHTAIHPIAAAGPGRYWASIALGILGVCGVVGDVKYIRRPPATPMAWWYQHMECMLGVGIGFHAAAFFFIARYALPSPLPGAWQLAPMLLPVAVGAPAMWSWIARYERRFDVDGADAPKSDDRGVGPV
jgi:hypothetical protein